MLLIHLPPIQNYLSDRFTSYLTAHTGYPTEIEYINVKWFNSLAVDGTRIYDEQNVTMIGIDELVLTFSLKDLLGSQHIQTKEAWIKGANINLRKKTDFYGLNIDDWAIKISTLLADSQIPEPSGSSAAFSIDKITLRESQFSISDYRMDSINNGFDYNHFRLVNLNADLLNLKAVADTFQLDIKYLATRDSASNMKIDALSTFFRYSEKQMAFLGLDLNMGKTHISDEVIFDMEHSGNLGYFVDSVVIRTNFDNTILHTDELSYFAPELKNRDESILIDGFFKGHVNYFSSDNFSIDFGEHTSLKGSIAIEGLPDITQTDFDIDLQNSIISAEDFKAYMDDRTFDISNKLGHIQLNGRFDGFLESFVADGEFHTALGNFTSNTLITISPDKALPQYTGELTMKNFDLGTFIE